MNRLRRFKHRRFRLAALLAIGLGGVLSVGLPGSTASAAPSDSVTFTIMVPEADPPQAVADLSAASGSEGQIALSWTAPDEDSGAPTGNAAASYTVRLASFSALSVGSTTTWWNAASNPPEAEPVPSAPPTSELLPLNGLEPGATYYFGILSADSFSNVSPLDTKTVGMVAQAQAAVFDAAPSSPTNVNAVSGDAQVSLTWNAVAAADLDFYRIDVDSTSPYDFADAFALTVDSPTTNLDHTGLTNGASYYYRLAAVDKGAPSYAGMALESAFTTTVLGTPTSQFPSAPSLTIDLATTTTGQISWVLTDNANNETELYLTSAPSATARLSPNLGPLAGSGGTTGYLETGLTPDTAYTRYGEAFNALASSFSAAVTRYTLANAPASLSTTSLTTGETGLLWSLNGNPGTTRHTIQREVNGGGFADIASAVLGTAFTDSGLVEGSSLSYRVYARNGDGVATSTSNTVSVVVPRVAPAAITDLAATVGPVRGSVDLTWTAPGDDESMGDIVSGVYRIDYSTDSAAALSDPGAFQIEITTDTAIGALQTMTVSGLSTQYDYYFRVFALDEAQNASLSNIVSLRPKRYTKPPKLTSFKLFSTLPGMMATNVTTDAVITLPFDQEMDAASLYSGISLRAVRDNRGRVTDDPVAYTLTYIGTSVRLEPVSPLRNNHTYTFTLSSGTMDVDGNALEESFRENFRTIFTYTEENVLFASDDRTYVRIPTGTLTQDGYLQSSLDPLNVSFAALSGTIQDAMEKERMRRGPQLAPLVDSISEFELISFQTGEEMATSPQRPMELALAYPDADDDGFVDGLGYRIHERFLGVVTLNEDTGLWVVVPGARVDRQNNTVSARVAHFSVYAVMPVATNFVGDAFAYPVPFVPSQGHTKMTFTNLALDTMIRIYSVSGALVRELHEDDGDGQMDWDMKNDEGEDVFSGVYLYVIKSGAEKKTGKLVVIR